MNKEIDPQSNVKPYLHQSHNRCLVQAAVIPALSRLRQKDHDPILSYGVKPFLQKRPKARRPM